MTLSTIAGGVNPTSMVGGISRSGTSLRTFIQAAVGAKEPMPSVSKKLTTAPSSNASGRGTARSASAARVRTNVKSRIARPSGTRSAISIGYPPACLVPADGS